MPVSYRPSTETIAAATAQTITFSDAVLPQGGFEQFLVETTGANNHIGTTTPGIDSVRVKLEGIPIIDIPRQHLRALIEALAPANAVPPDARLRFTIPCNLPWAPGSVGIPYGAKTSVEILFNAANSSAGAATLGWKTLPSVQPQFMPKLIQQTTNIPASQTNARIQINYGGNLVAGFILPLVSATGITRCRIVSVIDGQERQLFHADQSLLLESQFLQNPQSVTTHLYVRLPDGPALFPVGSFIEIDNGAASAAGDILVAHQLVRLAA